MVSGRAFLPCLHPDPSPRPLRGLRVSGFAFRVSDFGGRRTAFAFWFSVIGSRSNVAFHLALATSITKTQSKCAIRRIVMGDRTCRCLVLLRSSSASFRFVGLNGLQGCRVEGLQVQGFRIEAEDSAGTLCCKQFLVFG